MIMDVHHRGSYTSKQQCQFYCLADDESYGHPNTGMLPLWTNIHCVCETEDDKRVCDWRLKAKGKYRQLGYRNPNSWGGEWAAPNMWGAYGERCKGATTSPPGPPFEQFCYFPTESIKNADLPFLRWECDDQSVLAAGEMGYFVPLNGYCQAICPEGERVDNLFDKLYCTRPIDVEQWDTDEFWKMQGRGDKYFKYEWWKTPIKWGFTGSPHISFYEFGSLQHNDLWSAYKADDGSLEKLGKCHKTKNESYECPTPVASSGSTVTCSNNQQSNSICSITCNEGFSDQYPPGSNYSGGPSAMHCRCTRECEWSAQFHDCSPEKCPIPDWYNDANQTPSKCTDSNGKSVDFNATVASGGFLPGTTCQNDCPEGYGLSMGDGWPLSTCMCDYYGNGGYGCMFDLTHVSYCVPAVCSADLDDLKSWLLNGAYAGGFLHEDHVEGFDYYYDSDLYHEIRPQESLQMISAFDCPEDSIWSGTGDPNLDGKVKAGKSCTIKCQEGWYPDKRASPVLTFAL